MSEGDTVTLNCSLNGSNINWTLPDTSERTEHNLRNLQIRVINRSQSGPYKCQNSISHEYHNVTVQCK